MIVIREGTPADVERVNAFYESQRRSRGAKSGDVIILAQDDNHLVGVARLCQEGDYAVLRGMLVEKAYRRSGLGRRMLHRLEDHLNEQVCYCLPWKHLEAFYEAAGFKAIPDVDLPAPLQVRLLEHRSRMRSPEIHDLMQVDLGVDLPDGLAFIGMKRLQP